jgi:hypothetical protein
VPGEDPRRQAGLARRLDSLMECERRAGEKESQAMGRREVESSHRWPSFVVIFFFFAFAGKVSDILFMEKLFRLKDLLLKFQLPTFVMSYRDGSNHSIQLASVPRSCSCRQHWRHVM